MEANNNKGTLQVSHRITLFWPAGGALESKGVLPIVSWTGKSQPHIYASRAVSFCPQGAINSLALWAVRAHRTGSCSLRTALWQKDAGVGNLWAGMLKNGKRPKGLCWGVWTAPGMLTYAGRVKEFLLGMGISHPFSTSLASRWVLFS